MEKLRLGWVTSSRSNSYPAISPDSNLGSFISEPELFWGLVGIDISINKWSLKAPGYHYVANHGKGNPAQQFQAFWCQDPLSTLHNY